MTSSLVGSEMCIRDRALFPQSWEQANLSSSTCSPGRVVGASPTSLPPFPPPFPRTQVWVPSPQSVSYTHLRAHETRRHL
eukprot:2184963-Prorocentrum_lima.AAC.1